jgi:AraC-like DNA-binding protein
MIRTGKPLAEAALSAGFADQSHMSRMFKRTYGLTPAKWAAALVWTSSDPEAFGRIVRDEIRNGARR